MQKGITDWDGQVNTNYFKFRIQFNNYIISGVERVDPWGHSSLPSQKMLVLLPENKAQKLDWKQRTARHLLRWMITSQRGLTPTTQ